MSVWAGLKGRATSGKLWLQKGELVLSQQTLDPLFPLPPANTPAVSFLFILWWEIEGGYWK